MNIQKIKPLVKWLVEMGFTSIEIKDGEESLKLGRSNTSDVASAPAYMHISTPPVQHHASHHSEATASTKEAHHKTEVTTAIGHKICSPMVGTMYTASSPDSPPFVKIGQSVKIGDTLCIIEAMKMFNEIEADRSGVIVDILVQNGDPVEYDQPLFIIE